MPSPSFNDTTAFGLVIRFRVVVEGIDLGGWATCDGLTVDFQLKEIKSGGNNTHRVYLPDYVTYPKLVLTRAMNAKDSDKLMAWLRRMVDQVEGDTAVVTLHDGQGGVVSSWTFANCRPYKWTGPKLTAKSADVAMETLELVHEGFL